jgi:hypothetical protein
MGSGFIFCAAKPRFTVSAVAACAAAAFALCVPSAIFAQDYPPGTGQSGKAAAPIDLAGYWVALVTEDWRYRMLTAPKGDYYSLPLTVEARKVADSWDAAKDVAQGKQCLSYGAPALMRQPGRVHISWDNDNTLKVEMDAGKQTRLLAFGAPRQASGEPTLQGLSVARWQTPQITRFYSGKISARDIDTPGFRGQTPAGAPPPDTRKLGGTLKVVTTHLKPGYLRNNGVPYSANAVLTEYYDIHRDQGQEYLVITSIVDDPQYLYVPWVVSNHFRREPDGSKWNPQPCELILSSK